MTSTESKYYTAEQVAKFLGCSKPHAYKLIRQLNTELRTKGKLTIAGKVPKKFFEERTYS